MKSERIKRQYGFNILIIKEEMKILQSEKDSDFLVQPQNALIFYRNQYQSAATITIKSLSEFKIRYSLKTTNKKAYRVSSSNGQIRAKSLVYIDIMINQNTPLEQCLTDLFKLTLNIEGKGTQQKKFKVIIDYKKDSKLKESNLNYLQTSSRASGSVASTAATTMFSNPVAQIKKSIVKQAKLVSTLAKGSQTDRVHMQQQVKLDSHAKQIQEKRLRFQYLQQQHLKKAFRKKMGCYFTVIVVLFCFFVGIGFRSAITATLTHIGYSL